jgi:hypothetical protein
LDLSRSPRKTAKQGAEDKVSKLLTDARSEDAWIAMNYMIRLIKENQK